MHRVDTSTAVGTLPAPQEAGTPGFFTKGNPSGSPAVPATVPGPDWFNMVQEELAAILAAAEVELDATKADFTQVATAIQTLITAAMEAGLTGALFKDVSETLETGFPNSGHDLGNVSGTLTPDIENTDQQHGTVTGALVVAAPDDICVIQLSLLNGAGGPHAITYDVDEVRGDVATTVEGKVNTISLSHASDGHTIATVKAEA